MSDHRSHEVRKEKEPIQEALDVFFGYLDRWGENEADLPPEVERAFNTIVEYYTRRLIKVVRLLPGSYIARIYEARDFYFYAWGILWAEGGHIEVRTPAGVYQWLKTVIIRHKLDLEKDHGRLGELAPLEKIERMLYDPELKEFLWDDEVQCRYDLILEFFEKALCKLSRRGRQLINLVKEGYTRTEIKKRLNFPSQNAVSVFKRRVFGIIARHMKSLLERELDNPTADLRRKEIIAELLERFNRGGAPPCLPAIA